MQLVTRHQKPKGNKVLCVTPYAMSEVGLVGCRNCWQCRANRVNDLVGRCIAEQETSSASYAVTLTYAIGEPNSAVLIYRDFQNFMKILRRRGFSVRYIVAGEYGSIKGRAHWHAVLFFSGAAPETAATLDARKPWQVVLDRRFNWEPWPHGFVFFQQPDYGGFAYVLKYALKDQAQQVAKGHLAMSKKPPLGHVYFQNEAFRYVERGLAPQDFFYSFGHVFDAKRQRRRFLLQGKSRENFIEAYLSEWESVHGTPAPISDVLMDHFDKIAADEIEAAQTDEHWRAARDQWPKYRSPGGVSWLAADAAFMAQEMATEVVYVEVPYALYDVAPPGLVQFTDEGPEFISFAYVDGALSFQWMTEQGELKFWLVKETEEPQAVQRLLEWLRA